MEEAAGAATSIRLDLNVQLPDGAVSAESVREQLRLLARLGYGGAAVARPIARRLTRKDVRSCPLLSPRPELVRLDGRKTSDKKENGRPFHVKTTGGKQLTF